MESSFLKSKHEAGLIYADYLQKGNANQQENWNQNYRPLTLADEHSELLKSFVREMKVIVLSGIWCGDCAQIGPTLAKIAEGNPLIDLKFVERDEHLDLAGQVTVNAGQRVPIVIFCAEDFEQVAWYGDKSLSRYRRIASQQLGGAACALPGAPILAAQQQEEVADWVGEFERVHHILRLSGRLRQIHGD